MLSSALCSTRLEQRGPAGRRERGRDRSLRLGHQRRRDEHQWRPSREAHGRRRLIALSPPRLTRPHARRPDPTSPSPRRGTLGRPPSSTCRQRRRGGRHSVRRGGPRRWSSSPTAIADLARHVGRRIRELDLPPEPRSSASSVARRSSSPRTTSCAIEPDDHVLVFLTQKRMIPSLEKLFEVAVGVLLGEGRHTGSRTARPNAGAGPSTGAALISGAARASGAVLLSSGRPSSWRSRSPWRSRRAQRAYETGFLVTLRGGTLHLLPHARAASPGAAAAADGFLPRVRSWWTVVPAFATIPFCRDPGPQFTDAYFEAVSGMTTSGDHRAFPGWTASSLPSTSGGRSSCGSGAMGIMSWRWRSCRCWAWAAASSSRRRARAA